jgi:hypothetical protein
MVRVFCREHQQGIAVVTETPQGALFRSKAVVEEMTTALADYIKRQREDGEMRHVPRGERETGRLIESADAWLGSLVAACSRCGVRVVDEGQVRAKVKGYRASGRPQQLSV